MCMTVNSNTKTSLDGLEARRHIEKSLNDGNTDKILDEKVYIADFLALTTFYTRNTFSILSETSQVIKKSAFIKILSKTTQPAHIISIIVVILICDCISPMMQDQHSLAKTSKVANFVYLGSFCAHFGCQIWMTFVSGLALYFSLPRHTFGRCQEILFPKYFLLNTIFSCMTLVTFAKFTSAKAENLHRTLQIIALALCALIEMIIYLYLTPTLLHFMRLKYFFEGKLGNGREVGHQEEFRGINDPSYQMINRNFRSVHVKCALGNVIAICCSFFHLYYVASNIQVL